MQTTLLSFSGSSPTEAAEAIIKAFCRTNRLRIGKLEISTDLDNGEPCSRTHVMLSPPRKISFSYDFRPKDIGRLISEVEEDLERIRTHKLRDEDSFASYTGFGRPVGHAEDRV